MDKNLMTEMCNLAGVPVTEQRIEEASKLSKDQINQLRPELVKNGVPVRFLIGGGAVDILTGKVSKKGINVMHQPVYWNFTKETAKKVAKMLGAKAVFSEGVDYKGEPIWEAESQDTASVIRALRDTDYKDSDAFFKMTQLLKGLAVAAEKDELAEKYLAAISDALTNVANKVLTKKR